MTRDNCCSQTKHLINGWEISALSEQPRSSGNIGRAFRNGSPVVVQGIEQILNIDLLSDGRIIQDGQSRILLLSEPSDVYGHGILGDRIEPMGWEKVESDCLAAGIFNA